ncbi:hypothetical protein BHE16_01140 [Neomicrococcus aestuarii]|uniref:DivIVA domain-containing protein n=1 Tax=Neomicrococcus aestuarii TaxID=556325 RepID=A0A1L2ZLE2_9MICC|nr:hypothetical protein BHE16_01140 [Neomicrococcus aestuarii]
MFVDSFLALVWWIGGAVAALAVLVVVADKLRRHLANKKLARQLMEYEERHRKATSWPGSVTAEELENVKFSAVTFHEGYETLEVDNLLSHVHEALVAHERGPRYRLPAGILMSTEIPEIAFSTTKNREGYHQGEVDAFVNRIFETLHRYEQGRGEFAFPRVSQIESASAPQPSEESTIASEPRRESSPVARPQVQSPAPRITEAAASQETSSRKPHFRILPGHVDGPPARLSEAPRSTGSEEDPDVEHRRTGSWG